MDFLFNRFFGTKINILVVCTANICRSPMAHAVLREMIKARGLTRKITVNSAGTHVPIMGLLPDKRSLMVLKENAVNIKKLKTRQFFTKDIEKFNYILVMDNKNLETIRQRVGMEASNVKLLLENGLDVPDPYYAHPDEFRHVFNLIETACKSFLETLIIEHNLEVSLNNEV